MEANCDWVKATKHMRQPRTDDASVRANYVQFAPEVSGRLLTLAVKDNALAHKGDLLFALDPRQYEYALQQALADQRLLEAQITDARRRIASESSAVEAARGVERLGDAD
jgi:multidrug efflux system membrane fusion protein